MTLSIIADRTIPRPLHSELNTHDGDTGDIMAQVLLTYSSSKNQLSTFAGYLRGATLKETCYNIWRFIKSEIRYEKDPKGKQWVRRPARFWADKKGDCKSYSVFIAAALYNLGIKGTFRFISETPAPIPSHVYVVVRSGNREIIIDPVMPSFNKEVEHKQKFDYNMTQISELAGIRNRSAISGGLLQNVLLGGKRREVLNASLPGLAILALYQWIPAGPNGPVGFPQLKGLLATNDNLLQYCSPEVIRKRQVSFESFWDFGAWANVKVENDVFPQMQQHLTQLLGMHPHDWWRKQFKANGIGVVIPPQLIAAAPKIIAKATNFIKGIVGKIGGLFGGTDIKWKRGEPSTWAPSSNDFSTWKLNPLADLNLGISDTGQFFKTDYLAETTGFTNKGSGSGIDVPAGGSATLTPPSGGNNTGLLIAAAAVAALFLLKR